MLRKSRVPRPLIWRGTSKADFKAFPEHVQREMGYALFLAQMGERHPTMVRTLRGFGGSTMVEVKESYDGNAYRAVIRCAMPMRSTCCTPYWRDDLSADLRTPSPSPAQSSAI
jgi:phage-related protein